MATRKIGPALAAGCTVVLKPSEMSATQTHVVTQALHDAGLPRGVFNIVTGRGDVVGSAITRHPDVAKISFTGSTAIGKVILREAAETIKRVTLELGGKSPSIILDDADLDEAVTGALLAGFANSSQACVAGTRILVPESRLDEFLAVATAKMADFPVGEPSDQATAIGPMVSERQWERVQGYIRRGVEEGARIVAGGPGRPEGLADGYFVRPTPSGRRGPRRLRSTSQPEAFMNILQQTVRRLERLEALDRSWELFYAARTRSAAAFLDELNAVRRNVRANLHMHFDQETPGRMLDLPAIVNDAPPHAHLYCCGPVPMLEAFEAGVLTRPYIIGACWNGREKLPQDPEQANNKRLIKTRSGSLLEFDDTANDHSSKFALSTPGLPMMFIRSPGRRSSYLPSRKARPR